MTKLKPLKKRLMEGTEEECKPVDEECALVEALVRARAAAKLTQAEAARRVGTTRSAISGLEGGRASPYFATLRRYAEAVGARLAVGLVRVDGGRWLSAGRRPRRAKLPAELAPSCPG